MSERNREGLIMILALLALAAPVAIIGSVHLLAPPAQSDAANGTVTIGEQHSIWSDVLEEEREYQVWLPVSYRDDTYSPVAYPVLYLLDGDTHFHSATGIVQYMSSGENGNYQLPEMIVVAIPNTDRTRDLTPTHATLGPDGKEYEFFESSGGAEEFLRFLDEELIPEIDREFRTLPFRTLVGHSFGGLFAAHALMSNSDSFNAYIAIDPSFWWDDEHMLTRAEETFSGEHEKTGHIYISIADTTSPDFVGDPRRMENGIRRFADIIGAANNEDFRSEYRFFAAEDHGSVPLLSLYHGLLDVFGGFKVANQSVFDDPAYFATHYAAVSERLGIEFKPPEKQVDRLGASFLRQPDEVDKAITAFALNVANYPDSWNAYDSLAEAHLARGEEELAVENFERSLELNPDNDNARENLAEIRNAPDSPP